MLLVFISLVFQGPLLAKGSKAGTGLTSQWLAIQRNQPNSEAAWLIHSPIPPKAANLLLEVELTTEEDENRRKPVSEYFTSFSDYPSYDEVVYNSHLKQKILNLNAQVDNRVSIAFFILYHSWKSYLS